MPQGVGVQVPPSAPLFWFIVVHILLLRSADQNEVVLFMKGAVRDILSAYGCTYDEIVVPVPNGMPIAINMLIENMTYEAILCIGVVVNKYNSPCHLISYSDLVRNLNEFSAHFSFPVGVGIYYADDMEGMEDNARMLAVNEAEYVCNMIRMIRQLNSLESEQYVRDGKHN